MMQNAQTGQPDLRQYLAVIKGRRWTIILMTLLCTLGALMASTQQTRLYTADAELLVKPHPPSSYFPNAENEAQVVQSSQVAARVIEDLELRQTPDQLLASLEAERTTETSDVIAISYTAPDPDLARDVANGFARAYLQHTENELVGNIEAESRALRRRIEVLQAREDRINRDLEAARREGDQALVDSLESERLEIRSRLIGLLGQYDDLQSGATASITVGTLLTPASKPTAPSSPKYLNNGVIGAVIGLILGVGIAFLRERLDDRFRGRPDVEAAIESPVLATVPRFNSPKGREPYLPVAADPKGAVSEAYRNLRTGLQFISSQRNIQTILVTSPSAHEGKTSTAANLGIVLAQAGRNVVLVSADLRRPNLEHTLSAKSGKGLSSWLLGEVDDIGSLVLEHPGIPKLHLLPSGPIPSNPAELLTSPRLGELIAELEQMFEVVLIDSPPVLPVADAVILASQAGAVVLVIDAANTSRSAAIHAKEQIERVGGNVVGAVLNAFDPSTTPYYYEPYQYSRYYYTPEEEAARPETPPSLAPLSEVDRPEIRSKHKD